MGKIAHKAQAKAQNRAGKVRETTTHTCRWTIMAVMLSQPMPRVSLGSEAMHSSTSAPAISDSVASLESLARTKSTASWLVMTSQTPSQASRRNSSFGPMVSVQISGWAVMICSWGCRSELVLYLRSPIALLRFRLPLTRHTPPISARKPPAASMRDFSLSWAGLWSSDRATAWPPLHRTALLSPALATKILPSLIMVTTAVQPAWILFSGRQSLSSDSMSSEPSSPLACPSLMAFFSASIFFIISNASFFTPSSPSGPSSSSSGSLCCRLWTCGR
mmetsp:Transcript_28786/g.81073  ORF Transcript_28786/g.81073 Transcript_28786/m.81073 type:complete len:276 (+) Transcript_28786:289-1116(+)